MYPSAHCIKNVVNAVFLNICLIDAGTKDTQHKYFGRGESDCLSDCRFH